MCPSLFRLSHFSDGKPVPTFPENALARYSIPEKLSGSGRGALDDRAGKGARRTRPHHAEPFQFARNCFSSRCRRSRRHLVPDIGKLLWPKSVAVVGASSDTRGLRGRILEVMRGHPFAGPTYPVSRSAAEVQGLKAYASVADLPGPV